MTQLNGLDVEELHAFAGTVKEDPARADRDPVAVARWMGGDRAEVSSPGTRSLSIGGDGPSAMRVVLMALAACDVDLIATRASMLGVEIDSLEVETSGHFNVGRYLGLDAPHGPGYQHMRCVVRLKTRNASAEQLAELRRSCEVASPVGDTLRRSVPLDLEFEFS